MDFPIEFVKVSHKSTISAQLSYALTVILTISWLTLLWVMLFLRTLGNCSVNEPDCRNEFLIHYTNWNWILSIVFFSVLLLSLLDPSGVIQFFLFMIVFWPLLCSTTIVFYLVIIILHNNPNILLKNAKEFGGPHSMGIVLLGNYIIHILQYLVVLYLFLMRFRVIRYATVFGFQMKNHTFVWKFFYIIWQVFFIPIVITIYFFSFDLKEIYGITISLFLLFLITFLLWLFLVLLPFYFILTYESENSNLKKNGIFFI